MRKLFLAALVALLPLTAAAQSLQINRSQTGEVGALVTATDPSGNTGKVILPSVTLTDSSGNPVPGGTAASTDASGTIATGNTYQTVFAASSSRRGCVVQNPATATENLNVRVKGSAVFTLPIGATFQCGAPAGVVISDLIEVTAATSAHAFTAVSQ